MPYTIEEYRAARIYTREQYEWAMQQHEAAEKSGNVRQMILLQAVIRNWEARNI